MIKLPTLQSRLVYATNLLLDYLEENNDLLNISEKDLKDLLLIVNEPNWGKKASDVIELLDRLTQNTSNEPQWGCIGTSTDVALVNKVFINSVNDAFTDLELIQQIHLLIENNRADGIIAKISNYRWLRNINLTTPIGSNVFSLITPKEYVDTLDKVNNLTSIPKPNYQIERRLTKPVNNPNVI